MKNDLLIKVLFSLIAGGFGLLLSLGSYAYSQTIQPLERRVTTVESKTDESIAVRGQILERLTRQEEKLSSIGSKVEEVRVESKERDQKLDRILEQVNQIRVQTK